MGTRIAIILIHAALIMVPAATYSMNWEGHDDWLEQQNHGQVLRSVLPKSHIIDLPSCDQRWNELADNPYEQRPLPGKNCLDTSGDDMHRD